MEENLIEIIRAGAPSFLSPPRSTPIAMRKYIDMLRIRTIEIWEKENKMPLCMDTNFFGDGI